MEKALSFNDSVSLTREPPEVGSTLTEKVFLLIANTLLGCGLVMEEGGGLDSGFFHWSHETVKLEVHMILWDVLFKQKNQL